MAGACPGPESPPRGLLSGLYTPVRQAAGGSTQHNGTEASPSGERGCQHYDAAVRAAGKRRTHGGKEPLRVPQIGRGARQVHVVMLLCRKLTSVPYA